MPADSDKTTIKDIVRKETSDLGTDDKVLKTDLSGFKNNYQNLESTLRNLCNLMEDMNRKLELILEIQYSCNAKLPDYNSLKEKV